MVVLCVSILPAVCFHSLQVWRWMVAPFFHPRVRTHPLSLLSLSSSLPTRRLQPERSVRVGSVHAVSHLQVVSRGNIGEHEMGDCVHVYAYSLLYSSSDWTWNGNKYVQVSTREWKMVHMYFSLLHMCTYMYINFILYSTQLTTVLCELLVLCSFNYGHYILFLLG